MTDDIEYPEGEGPVTEDEAKAAVADLAESPAPDEAMDLEDPDQNEEGD